MDRLAAMRIFVLAVDSGSLSAAARALHMPLATVSRRLSELEARLKSRLLTRSTRRLTLTDAGRDYLEACRRILGDVDAAERAAAGEFQTPSGHLVITAPIVLGRLHLVPVVADFLRAYPRVDVRLLLTDRMLDFQGDRIDLAVRLGELPDSRLTAVRVGLTQPVVVAPPDYLAAEGEPQQPADLVDHRTISFEAIDGGTRWAFDRNGADASVHLRPRLSVSTAEAALDAALSGFGLTRVLCYQADRARRSGALISVLEDFRPPPMPIHLVYPAATRLPLKLRAFIDFAAPLLRERLVTMPAGQCMRLPP